MLVKIGRGGMREKDREMKCMKIITRAFQKAKQDSAKMELVREKEPILTPRSSKY